MPSIFQPQNNNSPDASIVGSIAVTTPTNTGHASTTSTASGGTDTQNKSCVWFAFTAGPGDATSAIIKVDYTRSGSLTGASANNEFRLERSLDGGSNFFIFHSETGVTSVNSDTATFTITLPQDLTQVRVRVQIFAGKTGADSATCTATCSNVRIEVEAPTRQVVVMM